MIVLEFKLKGKPQQYRVIDEMIRTAQFVRNKALRYWIFILIVTGKQSQILDIFAKVKKL
jgi:hypothetical protein